MWFMNNFANPFVRLILRSPFHGLLRADLLLIKYQGRKSGKYFTLPVQYARCDRTIYILPGSPGQKTWWRNFRTGLPVQVVLHGKAYYIGPIYPALFAAGAVCLGELRGKGGWITRAATVLVLVLAGVLALPFGLPILPPVQMAKFCESIGLKAAVTTNRGGVLSLPQDYADMLGWEDQVKAVARAVDSLSPEKRSTVGLVARNYGEAGALEFYGPRHGLPPKVMLPDNFQLWPPDNTCTVVVTIGIPPGDLERFFRVVTVVEHFDNPWMVEEERNLPICIAKTPLSLSDTPALRGRPHGFRITVNELRISAGAGFVVVICGSIVTMPGLPKVPAAASTRSSLCVATVHL